MMLIPLRLIAAAEEEDVGIHKKCFGYTTTILVISAEQIHDVMNIVKSLEDSGLLLIMMRPT